MKYSKGLVDIFVDTVNKLRAETIKNVGMYSYTNNHST